MSAARERMMDEAQKLFGPVEMTPVYPDRPVPCPCCDEGQLGIQACSIDAYKFQIACDRCHEIDVHQWNEMVFSNFQRAARAYQLLQQAIGLREES